MFFLSGSLSDEILTETSTNLLLSIQSPDIIDEIDVTKMLNYEFRALLTGSLSDEIKTQTTTN